MKYYAIFWHSTIQYILQGSKLADFSFTFDKSTHLIMMIWGITSLQHYLNHIDKMGGW